MKGWLIMNIAIAKGDLARSLNTSITGSSYEMLNMNCREKRRVMFVRGQEDFSSYLAHSDYERKINTHPCLASAGIECPSCQAGIPTKFKTVILFWDIDRLKILVWDTVKKHMLTIYNLVDKYPENYLDLAFTIRRIGKESKTEYIFTPINDLTPEEKERCEIRKQADIPKIESVINLKTPDEIIDMLVNKLPHSALPVSILEKLF